MVHSAAAGPIFSDVTILPDWMRAYDRAWLSRDLVAGLTLAAVAIPEVMGYTSIAGTPIVTGIYTIIFPTLLFALLGSSRLLVVGADSATAAILAAGLAGLGISGLEPGTDTWLAWAGLVALLCAAMLFVARLLRLGFLGDFLSASVLIGFLTGVGIQVFTGQIPEMLGVPKPDGNWFQQQWGTVQELPDASLQTAAFAIGTVLCIYGFKWFLPRVPGAVVAVVLAIVISTVTSASAHGVTVVGDVQGGFPPLGLPGGLTWGDVPAAAATAFACFVLIVAQSSATSRSFAAKHGQRVDVNRDLVGLGGANLAAGLTGTFVVNGSPTKTEILDDQKGRTQVANIVMALVALVFVLFAAGLLTNMPTSVLAGIVFVIGIGLIDLRGLRRIRRRRFSEFVIALVTSVVVFGVGVGLGIALAVVLSILEIIRRAYRPSDFVIGKGDHARREYVPAEPGAQSLPGLVVFRFDAQLFYANANRFLDDVKAVFEGAPDPVRWLVLDCSAIDDVDYSAGVALVELVEYVHQSGANFGIARADDRLLDTLRTYGVLDAFSSDRVFRGLGAAFAAYERTMAGED
jgi:high affinity sulfate transporter 1